jgi:hypothetical protein
MPIFALPGQQASFIQQMGFPTQSAASLAWQIFGCGRPAARGIMGDATTTRAVRDGVSQESRKLESSKP